MVVSVSVDTSSPIASLPDSHSSLRATAASGLSRSESSFTYAGPARDFEHLCRAFGLVHDRYFEFGYMQQHVSGMRYSLLNLLPQSTTFVVERGAKVVGTLSVVIDSKAGLPGKAEFGEEFSQLQAQGRIVAEATMFACLEEETSNLELSMQLMTLAFHWCVETGIDDLCLVVNPRHLGFYEKILGFERLGEPKAMSHVEGNAGILLRFDVAATLKGETKLTRHASRLLKHAEDFGVLAFHRFQMLEIEVATLIEFCPELLLEAEPMQREMLEHLFPLACALVEENYGFVPSLSEL